MKRLLLAGGDKRAVCLAETLAEEGYSVETLGLGKTDSIHWDTVDAALFPYPFSVRNGRIPTLSDEKLIPDDVLKRLPGNTLLIAGRGMEGYLAQESGKVKRYTDADGFEKRNAELSAEAAVCEAMLHSRLALMDARILITGYGLFGRETALRLKMLGAEVWVAARREAQRMKAAQEGMKTVSILEMADVLPHMDLILNTVPARIFGEYHLKRIRRDCWYLELASAPYGVDPDTAKAAGINCTLLSALPARYSPASAAMALRDAVIQLIGEGRT